jgi:hypothetical protein
MMFPTPFHRTTVAASRQHRYSSIPRVFRHTIIHANAVVTTSPVALELFSLALPAGNACALDHYAVVHSGSVSL